MPYRFCANHPATGSTSRREVRVNLNWSPAPWMPIRATTSRQASHILPIALALVLLPAIAFASPPDPSWTVGIYDGADGDDIVTLIAESAAAPAPLLAQIPPPLRLFEKLPPLGLATVHDFSTGLYTRGPPLTPPPISSPSRLDASRDQDVPPYTISLEFVPTFFNY